MISYQLYNETTILFSQLAEIGERIEEEVFPRFHNSKISTWLKTASSKVTMLLTSSADWLQGIPVTWSGFLSLWRSVEQGNLGTKNLLIFPVYHHIN